MHKPELTMRGFTLIELLVAVGIISILASIVMVSLSGTKEQGNAVAVKGDLSTIQTQGVLYFEIGNTYGADNTGSGASCTPSANGVFRDTGTTIEDRVGAAIAAAQGHATGGSAEVYCRSSSTAFLVAAKLPNEKYWCIDSIGSAKEKDTAPGNTRTDCNY